MNQPSGLPDGQNKFLWFVVVFGALFFFAAVSMARPARYSRAFYAPSQLNTTGGQMYCIDPGIARPPVGVGRAFSPDQSCQWQQKSNVPPSQWNGGYPRPFTHRFPAFDFPALDLTPLLKALVLLFAIAALPLLHGWLLGQAWRYLYPLDEADKALHLAWRISADLMALTIPAALLYVLHIITNLPFLVGAVTLIVVITDIVISVRITRRREFTDAFTRKLAVATGLLSLTVPAGIAGTLLSGGGSTIGLAIWPIIASLILGFALYRYTLTEYLDRFQALATRWQLDHLALEILSVCALIFTPLSVFSGYLISSLRSTDLSWLPEFIGAVALCMFPVIFPVFYIGLAALLGSLSHYVSWRGSKLMLKKKGASLELHEERLFEDDPWLATLMKRTALWIGGSVAVSAALLIAERLWLQ